MEVILLLGVIGLWVLIFSLIFILCGIGNELDLINSKIRDVAEAVRLLANVIENLEKE
jgi:hypothetical protein